MNISLGAEFDRRIKNKIESGLYTSVSEVIRGGLRLLFEKDITHDQQLEILRQEISKGFEQLASGDSSERSVMDIFEQASKVTNAKL